MRADDSIQKIIKLDMNSTSTLPIFVFDYTGTTTSTFISQFATFDVFG